MKAIEQLERLKRMNELIKAECTGTPEEFSKMLRISESHLSRILENLKDRGVPVKYSRTRKTYYYPPDTTLKVEYSIRLISDDEIKNIFGGCGINPLMLFLEVEQNYFSPRVLIMKPTIKIFINN